MSQTVAEAKPAAKPKMKLRSVNIRKVENGFIGSASYEIDREASKSVPCCGGWEPDKDYVLSDREAIHKFLDDVLGTKPKAATKSARFGNSV